MNFNTNPKRPIGYILRSDRNKPEKEQTVHVIIPVSADLSERILNCKSNIIEYKDNIDIQNPFNSVKSSNLNDNDGTAMLMRLDDCWINSINCFDENGKEIKFPGSKIAKEWLSHNERQELDQAIINYSYPSADFLENLGSLSGYVQLDIINGIAQIAKKIPDLKKSEDVKQNQK